jgi:hypothetical protein
LQSFGIRGKRELVLKKNALIVLYNRNTVIINIALYTRFWLHHLPQKLTTLIL